MGTDWSLQTDRTLLLRGLDAAGAVVAHAAGRVAFDGSFFPDEIVHLLVLPHAGRVFGPQVDQRFLPNGEQNESMGIAKETTRMLLALTEPGPIQKFSCCTNFTFS